MNPRRAQLARLLQRRRRRFRLLVVCLVTAGVCGAVAGFLGPRILIGGTSMLHAERPATGQSTTLAKFEPSPAIPLGLSDRLGLDPREEQANTIRWQNMDAGQRRILLHRYWQLADLDQEQQQRLFDRYQRFRNLPEARRRFLRQRAQKLKAFLDTLSPQDQAVLESMTDEARARRLVALWQARYGTW